MDASAAFRFWQAYLESAGYQDHKAAVEERIRAHLQLPPPTGESAEYRLGFLAGLQAAMTLPATLAQAADRQRGREGSQEDRDGG